ncbi:uncharacterized protein LOC120757938 [Hirundo rustica]|uniref:uncharacterized protein LOC120757938 n=1 Tax=Hirundo rustica TaxID=43150 RepID=UPI001A9490E4|nr:uncharacterized protein LOC120757938 [Hirundo rustica]
MRALGIFSEWSELPRDAVLLSSLLCVTPGAWTWVAAELHPLVEEFISLHVAIPKRIAFIDGTKKALGFGEREKPTALIVPAKVLHASTAGVLTKNISPVLCNVIRCCNLPSLQNEASLVKSAIGEPESYKRNMQVVDAPGYTQTTKLLVSSLQDILSDPKVRVSLLASSALMDKHILRYILNNSATLEAIPKKRGICKSCKIYSFVTLNALLFLICGESPMNGRLPTAKSTIP